MDLNDYFDPVSLEKPDFSLIREVYTFSHSIKINTPDTPIRDIAQYDIAIMGVKEDKNAFLKGAAEAADRIREKLYILGYVNKKVKIIDLGNLKITASIKDTYFALRDILHELISHKVVPLIFGGSQDLTYGLSLAFNTGDTFWNLTTLDSKLDFDSGRKTLSSENYLDTIFRECKDNRLNYINIGHQLYFTPLKMIDKLENAGYESIRLGAARTAISETEPVMRDTDILSIDMSCVRQSDAPGASIPTPNGFFGHELCQITRYAGASDRLKAIGFFDISPGQDINNHTAHLAAQAAWYFIDGFTLKTREEPQISGSKKFIINMSSPADKLVFYKSNLTDRWWIELPVSDPRTGRNLLLSCSYEDYQKACNHEIPDRWWKRMRKYS